MRNVRMKLDPIISSFIYATIDRLSGPSGTKYGHYSINLLDVFNVNRITESLLDKLEQYFQEKRIEIEFNNPNIVVFIHLDRCVLDYEQTELFRTALAYTRIEHGNDN